MAKSSLEITTDRWVSVIGLIFTGTVYWLTMDLDESVRFFSLLTLWILFIAFGYLFVTSFGKQSRKDTISIDFQVVLLIVFTMIYLFLMPYVGYVFSTLGFCVFTTLMLGFKKHILTAIMSLCLTFGVYLLFTQVLSVPLPSLTPGGYF